jgi:pimeloyl-ACP methyl ester carboxylesterase
MYRAVSLMIATMLIGSEAAAQGRTSTLDVIAADGVKLRATYYSPGRPGPGMLLLHQCNMDRRAWTSLAGALADSGVHVIAVDYRGYGESPQGGRQDLTGDIDAAFAALIARPGVDKNRLAAGGASCGVNNAVQLARRTLYVRALLLMSGPTTPDGLAYLREHPNIPIFAAASSQEGFAVSSLRAVVATSKHPATHLEVTDKPGHGAPLFDAEPGLLSAVVNWTTRMLR